MDKIGVTFKGAYSEDIGIYTEADLIVRPIFPEVRKQKITIMGRHGAYDFSGEEFEERPIEVIFKFTEEDEQTMRQVVRAVAQWLRGKGKLIFDDEPDKYYTAKVFNQIDPKEALLIGEFKVEFECEPFAYATYDEYNETHIIDEDFELDAGQIYPNESSFNWQYFRQGMGLYNHGSEETEVKFEITGSVTNPKITHVESGNVVEIPLTLSNQTLTVDSENFTAKVGESTNVLPDMTGEFFILEKGANSFIFEGTNPDCVVEYTWKHKFL